MPATSLEPRFISGLPRSGSTLLGAILAQNPALSAGMSSPLYGLVNGLLARMTNANEFNIFIDDAARLRLLKGLFESYYADRGDKIVIDTSRHWTAKLPLLLKLFPNARLVCCVRPVPEIIESFERLFRERPEEISRLVNHEPETNVYNRTDHLMSAGGVVGFALNALKEAFYGPHADRLMLISYNALAARPREVLSAVYGFLNLPPFEHDLETIRFDAGDYDRQMGLLGLHAVRPRVQAEPHPHTLPPDIIARLAGVYFWDAPPKTCKADLRFLK
jgi:sulfotransferase